LCFSLDFREYGLVVISLDNNYDKQAHLSLAEERGVGGNIPGSNESK